jgi:Transposase, Mutator family
MAVVVATAVTVTGRGSYFARNLLAPGAEVPKATVAAISRIIFAQLDTATIDATWDTICDHARLAQVWSTNLLERVNRESNAEPASSHLPNEPVVVHLVGDMLADMDDEWQVSDRRRLSEDSTAQLNSTSNDEPSPPPGRREASRIPGTPPRAVLSCPQRTPAETWRRQGAGLT